MGVTEIALLFLDRELRIQHYTSGMKEIFNLMESDKGRPISHLASKLAYTQIVADAEQVLRDLIPVEREVPSGEGQWFLVRLRPYRTTDDRIDGVVIGIMDITAIKKAERTQQNYESFYALFHSNPIPTLLTRLEDGVVMNVNLAFLNFMGIQREDVVGHTAREFNLGLDLESKERASLTKKLLLDGNIRNFEEKMELPSGEVKSVLTSLQYIHIEDRDALLSTFIDITERVLAERHIRRLSIAVTQAEQEERRRLSQVLHDDLQQRIFAVKMQLDNLEQAYTANDQKSIQINFAKLEEWLVDAINITRQLSTDLSPLNLRGEDMTEIILWLASEMKEQYGLEVEVVADSAHFSFDDSLQMILFQAIRELLFNVVKHAGTLEAQVTIKQEEQGQLRIVVSDKGKGFEPEIVLQDENLAHGLITIQHQLRLFGCALSLDSGNGKGTRVTIDCPVQTSEGQT
jgi:PAS domain S-box-containing protein